MQKAISVRQPWAWLIVNGHKDIENRGRRSHIAQGWIAIHASKGMTKKEYYECYEFCQTGMPGKPPITLPPFEELQRGGIVGAALFGGCVDKSPSPWFFGKYGYKIQNAYPRPFIPLNGQLGFFNLPAHLVSKI